MANCPKCGRQLRLWDLSQNCPGCGVNMRRYNFEDEFYREAKMAELSNAVWHIRVRHLKAAFIGTKLNIVRLVVILLPILALLAPAGTIRLDLPFMDSSIPISGLGLFGAFGDGTLMYLIGSSGSWFSGAAFSAVKIALFGYAAIALLAVAVLISTVLCFVSYLKMQRVIAGIAFGGIGVSVLAFILILRAASVSSGSPVITCSAGWGIAACVVAFGVVAAINLILHKKGIPVDIGEGMEERREIYFKVKHGEVKIEDLSQPVVETEETRKIEEEIKKAEEGLLETLRKEGA